ncbi:hypothetical protein OF117_16430 [Geodermatophilus sp. YIM 151500]|nr:hypothetical protein [Geodermatophilus sp. YIM 151500]MCV2490943.1 hypothetical protein [Geodermatophilus sp. YIM 151500]
MPAGSHDLRGDGLGLLDAQVARSERDLAPPHEPIGIRAGQQRAADVERRRGHAPPPREGAGGTGTRARRRHGPGDDPSEGARQGARLGAPAVQVAVEGRPVPGEPQARCLRQRGTADGEGPAAAVEHAEVAHQRFQAGAVARGADDDVRIEPPPVDQPHPGGLERLDLGDDRRVPAGERGDEAVVGRRAHPGRVEPGGRAGGRPGHADAGEVPERQARDGRRRRVLEPHRRPAGQHRHRVQRQPGQPARHHGDAGPRRHPQPGDVRTDQRAGQVHARVAEADDEHAVTGQVGRPAHLRRVHHDPAELLLPRPVRPHGHPVGSGGEDDVGGVQVTARGARAPAGIGALDPPDRHAPLDRQVQPPLVLLQVGHDVVAVREGTGRAREAQPGQLGEPPVGVQPQPVVAIAPRLGDPRSAVDHAGPDALPEQGVRRGQAGRAGTDDEHAGRSRSAEGHVLASSDVVARGAGLTGPR